MRYIIHTYKGKERKLAQALIENFGIHAQVPPIKEYVICDKPVPMQMRSLSYVLSVMEASDDEADRMLQEQPGKDVGGIAVGGLVRISEDPYREFTGRVRAIDNGSAVVEVLIFGRVMMAKVAAENLAPIAAPAIWR